VITLAEEEGIGITSVSSITDGEKGVHGKVSGALVSMVRAEEEMVSGVLTNALASARKEGHGASLLLKDDKPVALFTFIHDDLRAGAEDLIKRLHSQGINVEMLSGDNQGAVDALAKSIGIPAKAAHGEMTPEDKVAWVKGRSKTHVTMMVGDGFNDAAAMAAADIGIAIGTGESTNLDAADVLIPGNQTGLIADILIQARKTSRVLIQNLAYSVAITLVLVYLVLAGVSDNLALMVLVHEVSVIGVIINGARLSGSGGTLPMIWDIIQGLYSETMSSFGALFSRD
jgi:P-type E1-E2 ATPase